MLADRSDGANDAPNQTTERHDSAPVRSWSQYRTFVDCPKRWWLSKIRKVPRRPGVWLAAGTAVHKTWERYLRERV